MKLKVLYYILILDGEHGLTFPVWHFFCTRLPHLEQFLSEPLHQDRVKITPGRECDPISLSRIKITNFYTTKHFINIFLVFALSAMGKMRTSCSFFEWIMTSCLMLRHNSHIWRRIRSQRELAFYFMKNHAEIARNRQGLLFHYYQNDAQTMGWWSFSGFAVCSGHSKLSQLCMYQAGKARSAVLRFCILFQ